jgi:hypothetical protein
MYQGDAAHDGYVAETIDPSSMTAAWSWHTTYNGQIVTDGVNVVKGDGATLTVLSAATGSTLRTLSGNFGDPAIDGGVIYAAAMNGSPWISAYRVADGSQIFSTSLPSQVIAYGYRAPTVGAAGVYLGSGEYSGIYGINKTTGAVMFSYGFGCPIGGWTPAVIAAGAGYSLAIQNGAAFFWGQNNYGLGWSITAESVPGLTGGVTAIAAGLYHSLAVQNGYVYAWGGNDDGQLGNGTADGNIHPTPAMVPGLSDIVQVAADAESSYALAANGTLWVWGDNSYGELGLGDTTDRATPTQLSPPPGYEFTSVEGGANSDEVFATVAPVPEPATLSLLALGGLAMLKRRK